VCNGSRWARAEYVKYERWLEDKLKDHSPAFLTGSNMAISRRLILELGSFDENLPSKVDKDLARRLLDHGHIIAYSPDAAVLHQFPTALREYFLRAIWYSRGLCAFNRKHYGSWLSGPDSGRLLETAWLISSLIVLCFSLLCFFFPAPPLTLPLLVAAGFMLIMAFRRDVGTLVRVVARKSTVDDFILSLVTHLGEKVGCIGTLTVDRSKPSQV